MKRIANSVTAYLEDLNVDERAVMEQLRAAILNNLPDGFREELSYGMIGYIVPHELYPAGYHCNPKLPLPFLAIAAQKNFIAVYHMGIYADESLYSWFTSEYAKQFTTKLDIGKSCIRFKKNASIPFELIGCLVKKISVQQWINLYELKFKRK
ncbi:MAG: DUF1801 domain-containing protein [Sphingobacteriia bacterium]|nr:MAG: DUF1801 domain-containing protein [Sphingobacteriia bacterium]